MPAIERAPLLLVLVATLGCAAESYELGALADEGSGSADGSGSGGSGSGGSGSGGSETGEPLVDPLEGAGPLKPWQDMGLTGVSGGTWSSAEHALLVADAAADAVLLATPAAVSPLHALAGGPRGLALDLDGALLVAEGDAGRVVRVAADGTVEVLAAAVDGSPLGTPHAIVVADDGRRWVSDPAAGTVLRIDPDGTVALAATGLREPQGLALDPAGALLYVAERTTARILAHRIAADAALVEPTLLATAEGGTIEGLCIDEHGNVLAVGEGGLQAFAPDGTRWGTVSAPATLTDCTFDQNEANPHVLLTSATAVQSMTSSVGGPP